MIHELNLLEGDPFCRGEWCNPKTDLLSELPRDPFKSIKICDDLTNSLKTGEVLSVDISISCTPDYITYYRSIEGVIQILDGLFPHNDKRLLKNLSHSKVMVTFGTNMVKGFSIPLLTIRLDFFPDSDVCSLSEIEEHLSSLTPTICGYLCETEFKTLSSSEEIRGFVYLRMTSEVSFRYTHEFRGLLTRTDMLRWDWFISSSPTVFFGENLMNFRGSKMGKSMLGTDNRFSELFSNWGEI